MKAIWNNEIIAESSDTLVIEGNHYFPQNSVNYDYLSVGELSILYMGEYSVHCVYSTVMI